MRFRDQPIRTLDAAQDQRTRVSRRRLLQGLGALTVALSAPIWRDVTAFGQDAKSTIPKRFIGVFSANGTIASAFFPSGGAAESTLGTLPTILSPLQAHKDRLLILKGVHMNSTIEDQLGVSGAVKPGGPHMKGPGAMLTGGSLLAGSFTGSGGPAGWADRISVDQFIANRIGNKTQFASLEFGVRIEGQEPLRVISYQGPNQPNNPVDDPFQMYKRLFADANLSSSELAKRLADKQSVLDFLTDDITRLEKRVSSDDKARLEAHLGGIRRIEQQLQNTTSCSPISMPDAYDAHDMANFPNAGRLQTDLMVLAHTCDFTRVSTFMWANADSWQYYPWIGVNEEHHELSHAGDDDTVTNDKLITINKWHAEQTSYLLDSLAKVTELDGSSMLDNTLLLWGNELGAGNTHTYKNIPWLLAGGPGVSLRGGRYLQFQDRPHNDLLVSVCNAMGYDDVKTFGIPGVCTGALPGVVG